MSAHTPGPDNVRMFGKRKVDLTTDFGREFWTDHLEASLKDYDKQLAKAVNALEVAVSIAERMDVDGEHHRFFAEHPLSSLTCTSPENGDGEGCVSEWITRARAAIAKAGDAS